MDWYLDVWRKYAEFDGRSRRKEYWMFALFNFLIVMALAIVGVFGIASMEHGSGIGGVLFIPLALYFLAFIIPGLAVHVRRFHDIGKSGWMVLLFMVLGIIPLVGFIAAIVQLVWLCTDSDPGTNEYGPSPKYPDLAGAVAGRPVSLRWVSMRKCRLSPARITLAIARTAEPNSRIPRRFAIIAAITTDFAGRTEETRGCPPCR